MVVPNAETATSTRVFDDYSRLWGVRRSIFDLFERMPGELLNLGNDGRLVADQPVRDAISSEGI